LQREIELTEDPWLKAKEKSTGESWVVLKVGFNEEEEERSGVSVFDYRIDRELNSLKKS